MFHQLECRHWHDARTTDMPSVLRRKDGSNAIPPVHKRTYGRTTPNDGTTGVDVSVVFGMEDAKTGAPPDGAQMAGRVSRTK